MQNIRTIKPIEDKLMRIFNLRYGDKNMFKISLFAFLLILLIFLLTCSYEVNAHPPEDMVIDYDYDTRFLNITITHKTDDVTDHYIEKIKIKVNSEVIIEKKYSEQPTNDTFTYNDIVEAVDGDEIKVVAECIISGEIERQITVNGPERQLNLTLNPELENLLEGSTQKYKITAESDGNPVNGVKFVVENEIGEVTIIIDGEPGEYEFTYNAPLVNQNVTNWINITGTKAGYKDEELSYQLNITDIPGSNELLINITPELDSLSEGKNQEFILFIDSEGDPQSDADILIIPIFGNISNVKDLGEGKYSFTYEAPFVIENLTETLNINATKIGYDNGSMTYFLSVIQIPEPMSISIINLNNTMDGQSFQNITIYVDSNGSFLESVNLQINADIGIISNLTEEENGKYTFTYYASYVVVDTTVKINITAKKDGYDKGYLDFQFIVEIVALQPQNSICIKLFPETEIIEEDSSVNFTIYVKLDCEPIDGAIVQLTHTFGAVTNNIDVGMSKFTFIYLAPEVDEDTKLTFTITAFLEGYGENIRGFNYTIINVEKPDVIKTLDGVILNGEYDYNASFNNGKFEIYWKIEGDNISVAIKGKTLGWISIGFIPTDDMKDGDIIMGWVDNNAKVHIKDEFSTGKTGPHAPDTELGGTDDILISGGTEDNEITIIEFKRKLITGDKYDNNIPVNGSIKIIWALGATDESDRIHDENSVGKGVLNIEGGETNQTIEDNDSDGIPDSEDNDDDNDGYTDLEEKEAGTDPLDSASYPKEDEGEKDEKEDNLSRYFLTVVIIFIIILWLFYPLKKSKK